jgi:galactose mutarotase-like enzyme
MLKPSEFTINNEHLTVIIQGTGAEISSIKDSNSQEYIWQADPKIWGSHAPVLFPIIGALKNGSFSYKGKQYSVPKHGLIRYNENLKVLKHSTSELKLHYTFNDETLKDYPFKFEFIIGFSLKNKSLEVQHQVLNHGDDQMLFSLGGHPAFKCPLTDQDNYQDYVLKFKHKETCKRHMIDENGLQNGESIPFFNNEDTMELKHSLFRDDALIFKNLKSRLVSLEHKTKGKVLSVAFKDFNYLGIWAKTNGNFVCIEPWLGITDHIDTSGDFTKKEGVLTLGPGENFNASFTIEIH